ncbi:MAG: hypothetical protein EOO92_20570, partial [Pedobacter sp.]
EVYLISIMEFAFNDISVSYLRDVKLFDSDEQEVFYNGMGYKFLVLPNFVKKEEELATETDKWFYLLKNLGRLNKIPHFLDKRVFQLLFNIAEMSNLTKEQQELYDSDLKAKSAYHGGIQFAADKAAEKAAKDNSKLIAKTMIENEYEVSEIAKITRLSTEEIEKLKE